MVIRAAAPGILEELEGPPHSMCANQRTPHSRRWPIKDRLKARPLIFPSKSGDLCLVLTGPRRDGAA